MSPNTCIGFGPTDGKCTNKASEKMPQLWCDTCNKARTDHLDVQINALADWHKRARDPALGSKLGIKNA